jgi:hypothetical protein
MCSFGSTLRRRFSHARSTVEDADALAAVERKLRNGNRIAAALRVQTESALLTALMPGDEQRGNTELTKRWYGHSSLNLKPRRRRRRGLARQRDQTSA